MAVPGKRSPTKETLDLLPKAGGLGLIVFEAHAVATSIVWTDVQNLRNDPGGGQGQGDQPSHRF